jgi:hypothetical protein
MKGVRERALRSGLLSKPWCSEQAFLPLTNAAYRTKDGLTVTLAAYIEDVERLLSKALRPERQLVRAVKFSDGKLEEFVPEHPYRASTTPLTSPKTPPPATVESTSTALVERVKEAVAVTVARPVNGCPMPDFPEVDVRASRVLETFLSSEQIRDYRSEGAFITVGADTGRRYLVCNREKPALMRKQLMGRQLYDLDRQIPICVHDWVVPPPEEMLALHLCLTLPGRESELLSLPEIDPRLAFEDRDPYAITNAEGRRLG